MCMKKKNARETEAGKGNAKGRTMIVRDRRACDFLGFKSCKYTKNETDTKKKKQKPIDSEEMNVRNIL